MIEAKIIKKDKSILEINNKSRYFNIEYKDLENKKDNLADELEPIIISKNFLFYIYDIKKEKDIKEFLKEID